MKSFLLRQPSAASLLGISDIEWRVLLTSRCNLLLAGPRSRTDVVLRALKPHLPTPVRQWRGEKQLPVARHDKGTLVLHEVAALDLPLQTQLLDWLTGSGWRVHVVSTTARSLFSLVERGVFFPELYYRLNTMRLDLALRGRGC